jgi:hypothetical protein
LESTTFAARIDPQNAAIFNNRGIAHAKNGQLDRAIADFDEAIRLNPKDASAYENRGNAYDAKGQHNRAIADFDEAIRLDPRYAPTFYNRGLAYAINGQLDRAIADYDEAIRLDPNYTQAIDKRAAAVARKKELDGSVGENGSAVEDAWGEMFRGKTNTKDVLEEKAKIVVHFIIDNCDSALIVATAVRPTTPDIQLGEEEKREARAETVALLLTLVDRLAVQFLGRKTREAFIDGLEAGVAGSLQGKGVEPEAFQELLYKRYEEYSHYPKWVPEKDEGAKGTLFWEFGKKVASILCIERNALFQAYVTKLLLENFANWNLDKLLPEQK